MIAWLRGLFHHKPRTRKWYGTDGGNAFAFRTRKDRDMWAGAPGLNENDIPTERRALASNDKALRKAMRARKVVEL